MAIIKTASFQVLSVEVAPGTNRRQRRAISRVLGDVALTFTAGQKEAHRADFDYEPQPGFLYVRTRAISSRCNDNFDEFPASEIRRAYRTFVGKPVFVNHRNDDHRRARGVCIDAALHEDTNPDGTPDTWAEVLMEIDAMRFPMLAKAILAGHIDRTSMGCDVAYSECTACGNRAETPIDYCRHIPKMKGQRIERVTASGTKERVLVAERCFGLKFFENSVLVEEPADPTAFFLGVDTRGIGVTASVEKQRVPALGVSEEMNLYYESGDWPRLERLLPLLQYGPNYNRAVLTHVKDYSLFTSRGEASSAERYLYLAECAAGFEEFDSDRAAGRPSRLPGLEGALDSALDAVADRLYKPQVLAKIAAFIPPKNAIGEIKAPPDVDTLRDELCPVCGESDTYDGDTCQVCGFIRPPDQFMDPNLEKAKSVDLRQEADDTSGEGGNLACDNCGATFNAAEPAPKVAALPSDGTPPSDFKMEKAPEEQTDDASVDTAPKAGDACPKCGEGTLRPAGAEGANPAIEAPAFIPPDAVEDDDAAEDGDDDEDEEEDDDDKDGKKRKALRSFLAATTRVGTPPSLSDLLRVLSRGGTTSQKDLSTRPTKEQRMRPTLAALQEQQVILVGQQAQIDRIAALAGIDLSPIKTTVERRIAALRRQADENNPAQPVPAPGSEAPSTTTDETLGDLNSDSVTEPGATTVTDVAPDATTSLDSNQTVLDPPLDLNELDVTKPVEGTTEQRPESETRTDTEVRIGDPNDRTVPFAETGWTNTSSVDPQARFFASLRLARLRHATKIASGDETVMAQEIATSAVSDAEIQSEIDTLAKVVAQQQQNRGPAPRALVPTTASRGAERTVPSLVGVPTEVSLHAEASRITDDEMIFEA